MARSSNSTGEIMASSDSTEMIHNAAASSSGTTYKDDHHGGAISLSSEMIHNESPASSSGTTYKDDHHSGAISPSSEMIHNESPPPSPRETPTINNSSKTKSKFSIRSLVSNFKAKPRFENHHHNAAASSSAPTNKDDQQGEALSLSSEMIPDDLLHVKSALEEYMKHMNVKINLARDEFEELQKLGRSERDFDELRKAIAELKLQIPKIKSKCSIRSLAANFKAKFCVSKDEQLENSHHNAASSTATTNKNDQQAPSSEMIRNDLRLLNSALDNYNKHMIAQINQASQKFKELQELGSSQRNFDKLRKAMAELKSQIPLTTNEDDHHGGDLSKMIHSDLLFLDSTFAEAKKYLVQMKVQIHQAHQILEELQKLESNQTDLLCSKKNQTDLEELRKAIAKLKFQIPSQFKIRSADSNPRRNPWPNVNKAADGMKHFFYTETRVAPTGGFDRLLEAFRNLPEPSQQCLLCFFKFPPEATIKRMTMIYLWMGQGYTFRHLQCTEEKEELPREEDAGNEIFDELIEKGFIEPIHQNCSLEPNSCRMNLSVRSSLSKEAEDRGFTSDGTLDLDHRFVVGDQPGHSCMINVGEAIINCEPQIFENMKHIQSLYLGRWQSPPTQLTQPTHHIELADTKILLGLNKVKSLKFLSLRGISLITELPTLILELNDLKILDVQACHNLEVIPPKIGLLKSLTHLDMSECYFLENMPKSLAQLSNLEVLKGFFIGDSNNKKKWCTLYDLSVMPKLRKLNIFTSLKDFPTKLDLEALQDFKGLQKLTISWGGRSLQVETDRKIEEDNPSADLTRRKLPAYRQAIEAASAAEAEGPLTLPPKLQKLNLQCFPTTTLPHWLKPAKLKVLKKLYIIGGKLLDLDQFRKHQGEQWNVEMLRLKHLSELELDWRELKIIFPKLIYLHQVDCPKFTYFPGDEKGVWKQVSH